MIVSKKIAREIAKRERIVASINRALYNIFMLAGVEYKLTVDMNWAILTTKGKISESDKWFLDMEGSIEDISLKLRYASELLQYLHGKKKFKINKIHPKTFCWDYNRCWIDEICPERKH